MLTPTTAELTQYSRFITSGVNKSLAMSIAIAKMFTDSLGIPSSRVDNASEFYTNTYDLSVKTALSELLNYLPFDHRTVSELVRKFYMYRYFTTHPSVVSCTDSTQGLEEFFGLRQFFDEKVLETIRTESVQITNHCIFFASVLKRSEDRQ